MKKLIQKSYYVKFDFTILDSKLNCKESRFGNESDADIPFENIASTKNSKKTSSPILLVAGTISIVVSFLAFIFGESTRNSLLGGFLWLFISIGLLAYFFMTREDLWVISRYDGGKINIHKSSPNEKEVNEFIETLFKARKKYLKERYIVIDKNLSYEEQYSKIEWLKNIEAIEMEEFFNLHDKLKSNSQPVKNKVGFDS
jgi:hypothetical protein